MNTVVTVARRAFAATILLLAVGTLLVTLALRADAIRVSRVLTGSMGAEVPAGALVVARPADADRIERGQVVVFAPPAPFGTPDGRPIVHRVIEVTREGGEVFLRTKGDANEAEDPWTINASRSTVFRAGWSSALAGRAADVTGRAGATVLVVTIATYAAVRALLAIWRPRGAAGRTTRAARAARAAHRTGHRGTAVAWLRDAAA